MRPPRHRQWRSVKSKARLTAAGEAGWGPHPRDAQLVVLLRQQRPGARLHLAQLVLGRLRALAPRARRRARRRRARVRLVRAARRLRGRLALRKRGRRARALHLRGAPPRVGRRTAALMGAEQGVRTTGAQQADGAALGG